MKMCYKDAIEWLGRNDDCEWLNDDDEIRISVTASLVADIWGKDEETVCRDLKREVKRLETCGSRSWRDEKTTKPKSKRKPYSKEGKEFIKQMKEDNKKKGYGISSLTTLSDAIRNFRK